VTEEATTAEQEQTEDPDWLKQLRKDAAEAKKLKGEVAQLRRQGAMDELAIPKTGAGKLFRDKWDGDPDDLDSLKAAAKEYELIPSEDQPAPSEVTEALDGADAMADIPAGTGAQPTYEALLGEANSIEEIERVAQNAGIGVPIR
jgi:hypothetical protein